MAATFVAIVVALGPRPDALQAPPPPFILPSHVPTNVSPRRRCGRCCSCFLPKFTSRTDQLQPLWFQPRLHRNPERNREAPRRISAALAAVDSPALDCRREARHGRRLRPYHTHAARRTIR